MWILVPSRLMLPKERTPVCWARSRIWTNRSLNCGRKVLRPYGPSVGTERGDGIVIGREVLGQVPEGGGLFGPSLDLARGNDTSGVAIEQEAQQYLRSVRLAATASVAGVQRGKVYLRCHVHHEPGQVIRREAIPKPYRCRKRRLVIHYLELSAHTP